MRTTMAVCPSTRAIESKSNTLRAQPTFCPYPKKAPDDDEIMALEKMATRAIGNFRRRPGAAAGALLAPTVVLLALAYVLPVLLLAGVSFLQQDVRGAIVADFTLDNFIRFFSDPWFIGTLGRSIRIALLVTAMAVVLGYIAAYYLVFARPRLFEFYLVLVVAPILVGNVVRAFGWQMLMGDSGLVNTFLRNAGLGDFAVSFMYTEAGIVIADASTLMPLVILILMGVLTRIDPTLIEAAKALGANGRKAFWTVTFPLSLSGLGAASVICFTLALGTFEIAVLIGGKRVQMIAPLVYEQITYSFNWTMGAAVAVVLLVASIIGIIAHDAFFRGRTSE